MAKVAKRKVIGECACEVCGERFFEGEKGWVQKDGGCLVWYCERHRPTRNNPWAKNEVQFPRLLTELNGIGLTATQHNRLCKEMDIESEDLDELFERADKAWQAIKARTLGRVQR